MRGRLLPPFIPAALSKTASSTLRLQEPLMECARRSNDDAQLTYVASGLSYLMTRRNGQVSGLERSTRPKSLAAPLS